MGEQLYGAKCFRCSHLRHDGEHSREAVGWIRKPADRLLWCDDCDFCQVDGLTVMLADAGLGIFDPEIRRTVHAFQRGEPDPGIDRLRLVLQAMEATVTVAGELWRVVDADLDADTESDAQHLHLTITRAAEPTHDPGAAS